MKTRLLVIFSILTIFTVNCRADGLGTLIEMGKSQADIQKQYEDETKAFEKVKNAVASGAISKGQTKDSIRAKYGDPVVSVRDADGNHEIWAYKPASSSFFKGIRAELVFTKEGILDAIRMEER